MLLAVETSGSVGSVALTDGRRVMGSRELESLGRRHAQTLVAEVGHLLQETGCGVAGVTAVAVSIGPGSFTGLRVGLIFAKTFAWLNSVPLLAVDTLQALAQLVPEDVETVTTVIDAQRGELFAASYQWSSAEAIRIATSPVRLTSAAELPTDHPIAGPGLARHREALKATHSLRDEGATGVSAATVAVVGHWLLEQGRTCDPDQLEPVYIRPSYAEEKAASRRAEAAG
jgi:tRNA threonylcarbamoyladenosine biosynthesis protein TsaB